MNKPPRQPTPRGPDEIDAWLVDGFNVLHACLLRGKSREGWWRAERQLLVLRWLSEVAQQHRVEVVFDAGSGSAERLPAHGTACVLAYAPDADTAILTRVRHRGSERVCVVSADRSLRDRAWAAGAQGIRPWEFSVLMALSVEG